MSIDVETLAGEVEALKLINSALLLHLAETDPAGLDRATEYLAGFRSIAREHIVGNLRVRSRKASQSFVACLENAIAHAR